MAELSAYCWLSMPYRYAPSHHPLQLSCIQQGPVRAFVFSAAAMAPEPRDRQPWPAISPDRCPSPGRRH